MGIKLDWEVESEAGWSEIGEDAAALEARRRRSRHLRNLILGVVLAGLAAAGGVGWRLHQVGQQLRGSLESTVDAETAALRIGDRDSYLNVQAELGEWQRVQAHTFDEYQNLGERIQITGKLVEMEITTDQARVIIEETVDGEPYHVLWFYQHGDEGWKHIPPSPSFWGEQSRLETLYFDIDYYEQDRALADILKIRLNSWWESACRATACTQHAAAPRVRIEPDPLAEIGWAAYDPHTLIIPSPYLERMPVNGTFDPALFERLAELLSQRWAEQAIATAGTDLPLHDAGHLYSVVAWLESELATYLEHQFNDEVPPSDFLDPLSAAYSEQAVGDLVAHLPMIWSDQSVIRAVESVTGTGIENVQLGWESYLAQRLNAEVDLTQNGYITEAILLYRDPEREQPAMVLDVPTETLAEPGSIVITEAQQVGVIMWAEVRFALADAPDGGERIAYEPFRILEDRWVHTWPQLLDWGVERQDSSAHITMTYFDLDAPSIQGLLPYLEQLYIQTAGDYGLDTSNLPPVMISITPTAGRASTPALTHPRLLVQETDRLSITIPSPYSAVRSADSSAADYIRAIAARDLITSLLMARLGTFPVNHPFAAAFLTWELERHDLDADAGLQSFLIEAGRVSQPWPADSTGVLAFLPPYQDRDYHSARAVIDVLVDRDGAEIIPVLMDNLLQSSDVNDWLMRSAGVRFEDIQGDWYDASLSAGSEGGASK